MDEVQRHSWMVGDGFQEPTTETTYETVSNRTYLVATVFGYNSGYKTKVKPRVELSCLRPQWGTTKKHKAASSISTPPDDSSSMTSTPSSSAVSGSSTAVSSSSLLAAGLRQNYYFPCIALIHYALYRYVATRHWQHP